MLVSSVGNSIIQKVFSISLVIIVVLSSGQRCGRSDKIVLGEYFNILLLDHCQKTANIACWTPENKTIHWVMDPETGVPKPKLVSIYQAGPKYGFYVDCSILHNLL